MLQKGMKQVLVVEKAVPMGLYLNEPGAPEKEHVLLPKSQVPEGAKPGDEIECFLYLDSENRLIATRKEPKLTLHQVGYLTVKDVGRIGAFLDWGLEKDLLLPFHEQPRDHHVKKGQSCLVAVYLDKSGRLCATMNVYPYLNSKSPYQKGDTVEGTVYETSNNFGTFVAVDDKYSGLVPKKELVRPLVPGEKVRARVISVREDGKLNLSLREKIPAQIGPDSEKIYQKIQENGGFLPLNDRSDAGQIREALEMSKSQFKRAIGHLYKEGKIVLEEDGIRIAGSRK